MNKKVVKYVLIISSIVLLLGLGIWGYKYIKNRNDDKKTNENETDLKELANLYSGGVENVGGKKLSFYVNCVNMGSICKYGTEGRCKRYNAYATIYVDNSIKLKSSWLLYIHEEGGVDASDILSNSNKFTKDINKAALLNNKFIVLSIITVFKYYSSGINKLTSPAFYPYTKVFDATTGDMIFAVPTNSNEKIKVTGTYDGIGGSYFSNNMYLNSTAAIYYLKSNYTLTDGNNVEVHKVVFDDSYSNKYNDTIIAYTTGTITNS